jgi:ATP-dependent Clp protease ATP-binding subunit ClpA
VTSASPQREYTERAKAAVASAPGRARDLGHDQVHPGHLLLGVLGAGDGLATRTLAALGIPVAALGPRIEELLGRGGPTAGPTPPVSSGGNRALDLARDEAAGQARLGTEHLLLGIAGAGGAVADFLARRGATPDRIRAEAHRLLSAYRRDWPPAAETASGDELVDLRRAVLMLRVRELNEHLVDLRWQKRAALRAGEYDRAAALRQAELQLLEAKTREVTGLAREIDPGTLVDELDRLHHEVDRLRALLHRHHIGPDDDRSR